MRPLCVCRRRHHSCRIFLYDIHIYRRRLLFSFLEKIKRIVNTKRNINKEDQKAKNKKERREEKNIFCKHHRLREHLPDVTQHDNWCYTDPNALYSYK